MTLENSADLLNFVEPVLVLALVMYSTYRVKKLRKKVDTLCNDLDGVAEVVGTERARARQKQKEKK